MKTIKTYSQFIEEKNEHYASAVIDNLKLIASVTDGYQRDYYEQMLKDARIVKCSSVYDVFNEDEIARIKKLVRPKKKECYANAYHLTSCGIPNVLYCEGYMSLKGLPIEHAFNKVGDKYVDITAELALGEDVDGNEYVLLGEYDGDTALQTMAEDGYYGGVYNKMFLKNLKD